MINEKIICAGFGGQGVMTMGQLLAFAANEKGLHTLWYPSYGPETRGGTANCSITFSEEQVNSPVISQADVIIVMNKPSLDKFEDKVKPGGMLFINSSLVEGEVERKDIKSFYIPAGEIANELGNNRVANMVMIGAYLSKNTVFDRGLMMKLLADSFGASKAHLLKINEDALNRGFNYLSK